MKMKKIKLKVKGMHCKSCEMLIKDSLSELKGVSDTRVDHKQGYVIVEFDENMASIADIKKIIKNEGYEVQ
jgi:copper chaperone CopZ